jgi:predicted DsbA family dithiol-disulfide isomerase
VEAHRAIRAAGQVGLQDAMVERLFAAYFQEGQDIGDTAVLARLATEAGLDAKLLTGITGRAEVLAEDAAARAAGLNGVPSFLLKGYLLFSGAMPAEQMAQQFRKAHDILQARAA